ncbi:hypothetical protein GXP67_18650 [Rhodocytophaga rosea]|uniref:TonB C-terminal domain-containing protein n=1 Tax=Rhodocytophaga rosea TaxID=2704465 RepID=A0A6C0GKP3_9BACT|nr:hypothetical protein [Rhodocytophaga rosea]QHT68517.1 hypothetical protein GXP67_18650 [Rhodocytophaga rosea]
MIRPIFTLVFILFILSVRAQSTFIPNSCISETDTLDGSKVYTVVSKQPEYQGGINQFYKAIARNIVVDRGTRHQIDSRIVFTFIIDKNGQVREFCLIKPQGLQFNTNELVTKINNWTPGELDGVKVPVRLTIPMIIELR